MKMRFLAVLMLCIIFTLPGCGGGGNSSQITTVTFVAQILSDPAFDGDIEQTAPTTFIITQGMSQTVQSVFAGIDPAAPTEFRAFLGFPLRGPDGVPSNAVIESATLDIVIIYETADRTQDSPPGNNGTDHVEIGPEREP
jgi:hypothetical protein